MIASRLLVCISLLMTVSATRADESAHHFSRQFELGKSQAALIIVGSEGDAAAIEQLIDATITYAEQVATLIDWQNPASPIAQLNAAAGAVTKVSHEVIEILTSAKKISEWTSGAFDITNSANGNYKSIRIDEKKSTVTLAKGMAIHLDAIADGFLADLVVRSVVAANMHNALVRIGNVFRGVGQSAFGPWKIDVEDELGNLAHRALALTVTNTSVATLSAAAFRTTPLVDPRTKKPVTVTIHGATVVMNDATSAQGVVGAVFLLGPTEGMALLTHIENARGMIIDSGGNFLRSPGF